MKRHERLPLLLSVLTTGRHTAAHLARSMGVCLRTIYRDIAELERAGYRIGAAAGRNGGFWLHPKSRPVPLHLDTQTLVALATCAATHDTQGTLLGSSGNVILQHLLEALPAKARRGLEILTQQIRLAPLPKRQEPPAAHPHRFLMTMHQSFSRRKGLFLRVNRPKRRVLACYFEPETLTLKHGVWHLEGWDSR